jgi:conjugal transfer pilus assembly protein TraB
MSNSTKKPNFINEKWRNLSPRVRRFITVGAVVVFFFGAIYSFISSDTPVRQRRSVDRNDVTREVFTKVSPREVNLHGLAAKVKRLEEENDLLRKGQASLRNQVTISPNSSGVAAETYQAIENKAVAAAIEAAQATLTAKTLELESLIQEQKTRNTEATTPAPSEPIKAPVQVEKEERNPVIMDGMSPIDLQWGSEDLSTIAAFSSQGKTETTANAKGKQKAPKLRQIEVDDPPEPKVAEKDKKPKDVFIPAGSIFSGTLITGLDAPTGTAAKKSPYPTLLRIKKEALLPNRYRADVRECFLIASGYGDLSSERVYLRSETISCVRNDGGVIEAPIDMYAAGEDGKAGVRGILDTKQGQYLAKSLAAGFLGAVSNVFSEIPTATINTNSNDTLPFQSALSTEAIQSAGVEGASDAMDRLANFYIDMAQSVFPIVQIDAGRQVDFIMTRGTSLKLR